MTLLRQYDDPIAFLDTLRHSWEPREPELGLFVAVASMNAWRAVLLEDGRPITAVVRTPPHGFAVAELEHGGAERLARAIRAGELHLDAPQAIATRPAGEAFARAWSDDASLAMAQRVLALERVIEPPLPPGRFRQATSADPIAPWLYDFAIEATPDEVGDRDTMIANAKSRIERGQVFVWETDEGVVSIAALARPTPSGITVNGVYTPRLLRGRGYASACVARLTQHALTLKRFVSLYTDASNPTSNAMYERIGYRLVCESELWRLR